MVAVNIVTIIMHVYTNMYSINYITVKKPIFVHVVTSVSK